MVNAIKFNEINVERKSKLEQCRLATETNTHFFVI